MFDTLARIFSIQELRQRLLWTGLLLVVFRLGIVIPTPGINYAAVQRTMEEMTQGGGIMSGVLQMADMFTGGGLSQGSIFGLGIMPYITASIIFQLLVAIVPSLARLAHEGTSGRKKINQYTRLATLGLCLIHSTIGCSMFLQGGANDMVLISAPAFYFYGIISLTTGALFLMWLGEQIDEFGIGNGISLLIMAGIISRIPSLVLQISGNLGGVGGMTPFMVFVLVLLFVAMTLAVVMITLGTRRIALQASKATRGRRVYAGQRQFLPLKVNQSGVIPIIFAQSILQVLVAGSAWIDQTLFGNQAVFSLVFGLGSFWYTVIYVLFIIFFCYFMTAVMFNPNEMADNLKQSGMYLPGIRPGKRTAEYLEKIMTRVALAGSIFLALIAVMPQFLSTFLGINFSIASLLGGTALLIVVGVALDVVQRVESHLLMRDIEGFGLAGGRVSGRR